MCKTCFDVQIMAPGQHYEWAVVKIPLGTFEYCTAKDDSKEIMVLEERFRKARTLLGIKKR
jgi:hypothetical protein